MGSEDGDIAVERREVTFFADPTLDGIVDVEEPHDRLVLRPNAASSHSTLGPVTSGGDDDRRRLTGPGWATTRLTAWDAGRTAR